MRSIMRIGAIAALTFAGIVGFSGSASAGDDQVLNSATIELHFRECPADWTDLFEDCHHHPSTGYEGAVTAQPYTPIGEDGNLVFDVIPATYSWYYQGADAPSFDEDYIASYCSLEGGDGSDIESKEGDDIEAWTWEIVVEAGDHVVCDIYWAGGEAHDHDGGAGVPNTGAGAMSTGTSAGFFLAGAVALGGLAVASRKRALR